MFRSFNMRISFHKHKTASTNTMKRSISRIGAVSLVIIVVAIFLVVFFLVPISQSYTVPAQYGPAGLHTTIHTSLSCQALGIGEVNIDGIGSVWSNSCNIPSHVHHPESKAHQRHKLSLEESEKLAN